MAAADYPVKDGLGNTIIPSGRGEAPAPIGVAQLFTPSFSLDTPGNSAFSLSMAVGRYWEFGNGLVMATIGVITSSVSVGTGSGNLRIGGLPHTIAAGFRGPLDFAGITKMGYTNFVLAPFTTDNYLTILCGGSGLPAATVQGADVGSGLRAIGTFWYLK